MIECPLVLCYLIWWFMTLELSCCLPRVLIVTRCWRWFDDCVVTCAHADVFLHAFKSQVSLAAYNCPSPFGNTSSSLSPLPALFSVLVCLFPSYICISVLSVLVNKGPSIKYVTLEGEGSEKVWQFVTGGGVKSMWRHAYKIFIIHMKHEI